MNSPTANDGNTAIVMNIEYVATEYAGDPPEPVARWYKIEAGTYARYSQGVVKFFTWSDLQAEQSLGTAIEYVHGGARNEEVQEIASAWKTHHE